jgi:hypothetical protein
LISGTVGQQQSGRDRKATRKKSSGGIRFTRTAITSLSGICNGQFTYIIVVVNDILER